MTTRLLRSFRLHCLLGAGLVAMLAMPANAQDYLTLEASSDWRLREYDDRCRASRRFGEGENSTTVWIEQGGTESNFNLTLIGRPLRHPYGRGVHVQFGEEREMVRSYISTESSKGRPVLTMFGVNMVQPEMDMDAENEEQNKHANQIDAVMQKARAGSITTLRLRTSIVEPIELRLGPLTEPLAFLDQCGARLGAVLTEAGRPLSSEAFPPVAIDSDEWLRSEDYPPYLVAAGMEGRMSVRLTVNAAGRASSCFVIGSSRPQLFDDAFCLGLLKRARFEPARAANGDAVASYYFFNVTAQIR